MPERAPSVEGDPSAFAKMRRAVVVAMVLAGARGDLLGALKKLESDVEKVERDASRAYGSSKLAPALQEARASTVAVVDDLKEGTERAALSAMLSASGKCPDLRAGLGDAPDFLAGELAESLQRSEKDPSESVDACKEVVGSAARDLVAENVGKPSAEEKIALGFAADEAGTKICTDDLMKALATAEHLREGHKEQYIKTVRETLSSRVVTREALEKDLDEFCHDSQMARLFSTWRMPSFEAPAQNAGVAALACCAFAAALSAAVLLRARRVRLADTEFRSSGGEVEAGGFLE